MKRWKSEMYNVASVDTRVLLFWNSSNLIKACPGLLQAPSTSGAATVLTPPTSTSDLDVNFKKSFFSQRFRLKVFVNLRSETSRRKNKPPIQENQSDQASEGGECSRRRHHFPACRLPSCTPLVKPGFLTNIFDHFTTSQHTMIVTTLLPCMSDGNSYVMGTEWP